MKRRIIAVTVIALILLILTLFMFSNVEASFLSMFMTENVKYSSDNFKLGDMDENGYLDLNDAKKLLRVYTELSSGIEVEEKYIKMRRYQW